MEETAATSGSGPWDSLPFVNTFPNAMQPGPATLVFAKYGLIALTIIGLTPRFIASRLEILVGVLFLVGTGMFYGSFFVHRTRRLRKQLQANKLAQEDPPKHFALYLRSFRHANRIRVRNYSQTRAERILHGRFWDIELALSQCLADKLPVVALGATSMSLGAAKLSSDEGSWQRRFQELASAAAVVIIVPDQRPSTLWELERVTGDAHLRCKTVVVMPPEQRGWRRVLLRTPSSRTAWEGSRSDLAGMVELPEYDPLGAFVLFSAAESRFVALPLLDFRPDAVRSAVASAAVTARDPLAAPLVTTGEIPDERWWTIMDPAAFGIAAFGAITVGVVGLMMGESRLDGNPLLGVYGTAVAGSSITLLWTLRAYTLCPARVPPPSGISRLLPSTMKALRGLPYMARVTINFFLLILIVFAIRSFAFEPFKIPSNAMAPTLRIGDLILVNKFRYGVRFPVTHTKVASNDEPKRGDVVVFRYPRDTSLDYINRVVGLPGDEVAYLKQALSINGVPVPMTPKGDFYDDDSMRYTPLFGEKLGDVEHQVLVDPRREPFYGAQSYPMRDNCRYVAEGVSCRVPLGHYFVMGDNRDNSADSRFWGFVPDENIVGRAIFIWMNFEDLNRIGSIR